MASVLVVDDELSIREFLTIMLQGEGHEVHTAASGEEGIAKVREGDFDLVLTDLKMSGASGMDVLREAKALDPSIQVIVLTAFGTTATAVEAMKMGAADYITKPFKVDELKVQIAKALKVRDLQRENLYLRERLEGRDGFGRIVGRSAAMQSVFDLIERVSRTRTTVLISGESGTGKELVARAIHQKGNHPEEPFVAVNCGAIPATLIESELFGHVKGAFTGATSDRQGVFEAARGGTIFLDEVGELPLEMQVKLLRVLQERRVTRVGATQERELACRVVAATNKDLRAEVSKGNFREDLYYRLNVVQIQLPPLRTRLEDIPLLTEHFLAKYRDEAQADVKGITKEAMQRLMDYRFDGNIRELENIVQRAVALCSGDMIDVDALPPRVQQDSLLTVATDVTLPASGISLDDMVDRLERNLIAQALQRSGGVRKEAAKLLGVTFRSLRYRLEKHEIDVDPYVD
jgi:two-component system response regulator PilR (NtrC family)